MAKRKAAPRARKRAGTTSAAPARKSARKTAARKSTARKSTARKSTAKKSATRKSATRKSTARKSGTRTSAAKRAGGSRARAASTRSASKTSRGTARQAGATKTRKTAARGGSRASGRSAAAAARGRKASRLTRRAPGDEMLVPTPPSSLDLDRTASAARTGRRALRERFDEHTETGPAVTGGDVDADWESAYTVGDEAPGGDNPTPDQDIVDDLGRAVGVQYEDNEELKGDEKIARRDRQRWELDPASSEDYEDR